MKIALRSLPFRSLPSRSPALLVLTLAMFFLALSFKAGPFDSRSNLDWELLEAQTSLKNHELHIAESHFRAALRELGWTLGQLEAAEGNLERARQAWDQARSAAATDLGQIRTQLALIALQRGEVDAPLRELRLVAREDQELEQLTMLTRALWFAGREEEFHNHLTKLHKIDSPSATQIEEEIASRRDILPKLKLGEMAEASPTERTAIREELMSQREQIHQNLAALITLRDLQETTSHRVNGFQLSPVALMANSPPALRAAIVRLDNDDPKGALAELGYLHQSEDAAEAYALTGAILAQKDRNQEAETAFKQALGIDPQNFSAHQGLARLFWLADLRDRAITHLRAASKGRLDRDLAWTLADLEQQAGHLEEAARLFTGIAKRFESVEALLRLVEIAHLKDEPKRALDAAEQASRLAPNSEVVLRLLARNALDAGVFTSAIRPAEALVNMRPEVAEYHALQGQIWMRKRDFGEASEAFFKALDLDPDFRPAFLPLGVSLNHESRFAEAAEFLRSVLATEPDQLDALAALAEAEERLGDPKAAEENINRVLEQAPDHARAHLVLGMIHIGRGEFAEARVALEVAAKADPWLAKAHYQLSFSCNRLGDRDCARKHLALYKEALAGPEAAVVILEAASEPTMVKKKGTTEPMTEPLTKREGSSS